MSERAAIIVCIDDDPIVLGGVARVLRRPGLEVRASADPTEVLTWIRTEDVAVLVSDYEMPLLTGAQLAGRARFLRPETVRILLTGVRTLDVAIDGINQGEIFRFISKPFEVSELRTAVDDAIERHEELVALSGERERYARRRQLHAALEEQHPGISRVARDPAGVVDVTTDPASGAEELGFAGLLQLLHAPRGE